ncbi:MAG: diguanylate cyclase [Alphaproteobacteria bacterium]|nr:diguanylate cyclase [Alphaproteobacteria bacterium]
MPKADAIAVQLKADRDQDVIGSVSSASIAAYEEAVFRVAETGEIAAVNPAAHALQQRHGIAAFDRLTGFGLKAIKSNRAFVDMVDIGEGDAAMNLQVTVPPLNDRAAALCMVRDLTLDYSLRRALVDSRRRYRDFIEICADFTWETGPNRKFAFVAPRGALGYAADELVAVDPDTLFDRTSSTANFFFTKHRVEAQEVWLRRRDGTTACALISALPLLAVDGRWVGARSVCRDISDPRDREATFARVHNRERVLTRIVRAFRDEVNPEAMLAVAAEALARGLGADHTHVFRAIPTQGSGNTGARHDLAARYGSLDAAEAAPILASIAAGAGAAELVIGDWQVLAAPTRYQNLTNGAAVLWRAVDRGTWTDDDRLLLADIANQIGVAIEQLTHHEHVLRISRTDALTGLLNRGAFIDSMTRHLARPRPDAALSSLLYVDLDNFTAVNDTKGHAAGDEALLKVREILLASTRPTDLVARLGGDEFAVWLMGADRSAAESRARYILERVQTLAPYSGRPDKPLGFSIGIAPWSATNGETVDQVIARADAAMYAVKKQGKGTFSVAAFAGGVAA